MIENHPLQLYSSAFLFTPRGTITRYQFESDELGWLLSNKIGEEGWGQCLQTLEGHNGIVKLVAFPSSSTLLASGSGGGIIKIWDARSGQWFTSLVGHGGSVESPAFSSNNMWLASGKRFALEIWQTDNWESAFLIGCWGMQRRGATFSPNEAHLCKWSQTSY